MIVKCEVCGDKTDCFDIGDECNLCEGTYIKAYKDVINSAIKAAASQKWLTLTIPMKDIDGSIYKTYSFSVHPDESIADLIERIQETIPLKTS